VISYLETKEKFVVQSEIEKIDDIIARACEATYGRANAKNEQAAWERSIGLYVAKALRDPRVEIAGDIGVAIEYGLLGGTQPRRVDLMLSGYDSENVPTLLIVELKQWSEVERTVKANHVVAQVSQKKRAITRHPSQQALDYKEEIENFYSYAQEHRIRIECCSFLHNMFESDIIRDPMFTCLKISPAFLAGSEEQFRFAEHIANLLPRGDGGELIRKLDKSEFRASKKFVNGLGAMLDGNEYFKLSNEQKLVHDSIIQSVVDEVTDKTITIVKGGPGTGKSVVAFNVLVDLYRNYGLKSVFYVTKNAAPRTVYQEKLKGRGDQTEIRTLFRNSDGFWKLESNEISCVIVDEAHRLVPVGDRDRESGKDQLSEIINSAKHIVFFVDEMQQIVWNDYGTLEAIRSKCDEFGITPIEFDLSLQFRCQGGSEYTEWLTNILGMESLEASVDLSDCSYEIEVFDDPKEVYLKIKEKDETFEDCRMLAGYCWDWVSRGKEEDPSISDITIPEAGFAMRWNDFEQQGKWLISSNAINEVGCVYTMQGLEGDYMGVILGPNIGVENDRLVTYPLNQAKSDRAFGLGSSFRSGMSDEVAKRLDFLIRNQYRILLTRGMRGTYIYATDPLVREYFRKQLKDSGYSGENS
jgi:uncharacterized protein